MTDDIPESRFHKPAQPLSMAAVSDAAAYKPMLERAKAAERRVAELEADCERERMRLAAVSTAALDPKRLAGMLPEYHSATLMDVLSLRARLTEVTDEHDEALRLVSHASGDIAELQATVARLRAVADQAHALIDAWEDWGGPDDGVLVCPTFRTVTTSFQELERRMDALAPACICPKAAIPVLAAGCPEYAPVGPALTAAAPTYAEVMASCARAAERVATWPEWKQALSEPEPAPPAGEPQFDDVPARARYTAKCPACERPRRPFQQEFDPSNGVGEFCEPPCAGWISVFKPTREQAAENLAQFNREVAQVAGAFEAAGRDVFGEPEGARDREPEQPQAGAGERDESVPPPGWQRDLNGVCTKWMREGATTAQAWAIYDSEHGDAPTDAATVEQAWDAVLQAVAPEDAHHEWRWVHADDGFWYADDLRDGFTICSMAEIETWGDTDERDAIDAMIERKRWPAVAALVDARHPAGKARA